MYICGGGYKIRKIFCISENQHTQRKLLNLQIGVVASCQKLGIILENKGIGKLMLPKNVNNNKCAPKLIFFNEKKIEKDSDDF